MRRGWRGRHHHCAACRARESSPVSVSLERCHRIRCHPHGRPPNSTKSPIRMAGISPRILVTNEFYARVTRQWVTAGQMGAATNWVKRAACRWLRLSSHNCAVQRLIVMESLPPFSPPSGEFTEAQPRSCLNFRLTIVHRNCVQQFADKNLLSSRFVRLRQSPRPNCGLRTQCGLEKHPALRGGDDAPSLLGDIGSDGDRCDAHANKVFGECRLGRRCLTAQ